MVPAHNLYKWVYKVQTIDKKVLRFYKGLLSYKVIRNSQFNQKLVISKIVAKSLGYDSDSRY